MGVFCISYYTAVQAIADTREHLLRGGADAPCRRNFGTRGAVFRRRRKRGTAFLTIPRVFCYARTAQHFSIFKIILFESYKMPEHRLPIKWNEGIKIMAFS